MDFTSDSNRRADRPGIDFDDIERQGAFMRRAAREVMGTSDADDAVQDTWVALLECPQKAVHTPRAWLRRVVRNRAAARYRRESNRESRERDVARPEADTAPTNSAEKLELVRRVAAAIETLPPTLREPMVLRTYDGLSQSAIAERLGVTTSAVHGRLIRAKEQLRRSLEEEYGDGRWALLLAPWAGLDPGQALPFIEEASTASAATIAANAVPTATTLLGLKTISAGLACVVAACLLVTIARPSFLSGSNIPAPTEITRDLDLAEVRPSHPGASPLATAPDSSDLAQREAAAIPQAERSAETNLALTLVFAADGTVATGIPGRLGASQAFVTDRDGRATFASIQPGSRFIWLLGRGRFDFSVAEGEDSAIQIEIPPGVDVSGRAVDDTGQPVAGAEIILGNEEDADDSIPLARTAGDGTFRLRALSPSGTLHGTTRIAARATGHVTSASRRVTGHAGRQATTTLILPRDGGRLTGSVRYADGRPAGGAKILFPASSRANGELPTDDALVRDDAPHRVATVAPDGTFDARRLPTGVQQIRVRAEDAPSLTADWSIASHGSEPLHLTFAKGGSVEGNVLRSDGSPAANASVQLHSDAEHFYRYTTTDPLGHYTFTGVSEGGVALSGWHTDEVRGQVEVGQTTTIDLCHRAGQNFAGVVVDATDRPLAGFQVHAIEVASPGTWHASATTADDGTFTLRNVTLEAGEFEVTTGVSFESPALLTVPWPSEPSEPSELSGSGEPIRIVVPDDRMPTASLRFSVSGPNQAAPDSTTCSLRRGPPSDWNKNFAIDAQGGATVDALTAGTYTLTLGAQGLCERTIADIEVIAGSATDLGLIQLVRGGTVAVSLRADGDALPIEAGMHWGSLRPVNGVESYQLDDAGSALRSDVVPPGDYDLMVCGIGYRAETRRVTITAVGQLAVEVELTAGLQRLLSFAPPLPKGTRLRLTHEGGQDALNGKIAGESLFASGLWPGRWVARIEAPEANVVETAFQVREGEVNWDDPIVIATQ